MEIEIRKAGLQDLTTLTRMDIELGQSLNRFRPQLYRLKPNWKRLTKKDVAKNLRSKNTLVLIAEYNGSPVGFAIAKIHVRTDIFKETRFGKIKDLFVKPRFRTQGVGKKLLNTCIAFFKKKRLEHFFLATDQKNKLALNAYNEWGLKYYRVELIGKIV